MLHKVGHLFAKCFLLGQITLILCAISDSLIQILFYASIFKLNLPETCLLLTAHRCLLVPPEQPLTNYCSLFSHSSVSPSWRLIRPVKSPPAKSVPHQFFSASAPASRMGDFYSRISISQPSG